ncbi:IclR family transcriptional regulator C-terminal domain-containing protein [Streptomyces chartreusis]
MRAGRLRALTAASVRDPALLRRELRRVRQRGVATDVEEAVPGRSCVAMPIVLGGEAVAAVSIGFPTGSSPWCAPFSTRRRRTSRRWSGRSGTTRRSPRTPTSPARGRRPRSPAPTTWRT